MRTCHLAAWTDICLVSSSHKSDLLFVLVHLSAMQAGYGVVMNLSLL